MLWSRLEQLVRERDFYTAHLSEHRRLFAFTNCSLGTAEEVREEVSTHAPWRLLQTAWRAWSKRLVQTQAEIHSEKTNSTRQRGVTHISSETKKIRTCATGRWLNMSHCFVGNSLTRCSLSVYLSLSHPYSRQHLSTAVQLSQTKRLLFFFLPSPTSLFSLSFRAPSLFIWQSVICSVPWRHRFRLTKYCCFLSTQTAAQWLQEWHVISFLFL